MSTSSGTGGGAPNLCGNGHLDPGEACDGNDLGGKDCTTYGLTGGPIHCTSLCSIVITDCTQTEICDDGLDNDMDGQLDCADSDCLLSASCNDSCPPSVIVNLTPIDSTLSSFSSTLGHPSVHSASCSTTNGTVSGSEIIYEVTTSVAGEISVVLSSDVAMLTISLRGACGNDVSEVACSPEVPIGSPGGQTNQAELAFNATAGTTYFVMVDTVGPLGGDFAVHFTANIPPQNESSCNDLFDNDGNGFVDCDDPFCQGGLDCSIEGEVATGQPCDATMVNACAANKGDPVCLSEKKGFPGSYCSEFCDLTTPDCAGDAICAQLGISTNGVCLDGCVADADCRAGYTCQNKGYPGKVCLAPPETCDDIVDDNGDTLTDCEDPICQALPDCVAGAKAPGQPCSLNTECFSATNDPLCISAAAKGWPGGYCSESCSVGANDCIAGSECYDTLNLPSNQGQCLHVCTSAADCRPGYPCVDVGLPKKVCTL